MRAEQVTEPVTEHGEGGVWVDGTLRFVDIPAGDLLTLRPDGGVDRRHVDSVLTALRPRAGGGLVVAVERGIRLLDAELGAEGPERPAFTDPRIRMNDGGCDPQGRFYIGTMAYAQTPGAATLYRFDPDGGIATVLTDVTISNGIQWTADGGTVLYIDTPTGRVDSFDFDADAGMFSGRRPLVTVQDDAGKPDGMAIDAEDGLWVALWGGSAVHRYTPDGELDAVIEVPVPNPTSCAIGGERGTTLYITTSRQGGGDVAAASGAVFAAEIGVRSGPVHPFRG